MQTKMETQSSRILKLAVLGFVLSFIMMAATAYAITPTAATKIQRITGATPAGESLLFPNNNNTHTAGTVYGTDLGIMWESSPGNIMTVFGDTYGADWVGSGAGGNGDWRSNVLALSTDTDPSNGFYFSSWVTDTSNHAKEIIVTPFKDTTPDLGYSEWTKIPTAGVSLGSTHYIHYMSVHDWTQPGTWITNFSSIATSTDGGQNWTKQESNIQWSRTSNFAQAAYVKDSTYVYMFGTPSGRFGNAYLARVTHANILSKGSYQYWNGSSWITNDESAAVPIVTDAVAELSVVYNSYYGKWIMTYLDTPQDAILLRDASSLTGPWSTPKVVTTGSSYQYLYGSYIHPTYNSGPNLYFVMTQWTPYNTFLMRSTLNNDGPSNVVADNGFENQTSTTVGGAWSSLGNAGIDLSGYSRSGSKNAWLRNTSTTTWNAVKQNLTVTRNTNYTISMYIRTSANAPSGYYGVRYPNGGSIISEQTYGASSSGYTLRTFTFNSGNNANNTFTVELFSGMYAGTGLDTWVQIDDFSLTALAASAIADSSFENSTSTSLTTTSTPWYKEGGAGIDTSGYSHSGNKNGYMRSSSGWNAISQKLNVTPGAVYSLRSFVRTSTNHITGYFGARVPGGVLLGEVSYSNHAKYWLYHTPSFTVPAGVTQIEVYVNMLPNNNTDTWVQVDDVAFN